MISSLRNLKSSEEWVAFQPGWKDGRGRGMLRYQLVEMCWVNTLKGESTELAQRIEGCPWGPSVKREKGSCQMRLSPAPWALPPISGWSGSILASSRTILHILSREQFIAKPGRMGGLYPKKPWAPQRVLAKHFKKPGEGGRVTGYRIRSWTILWLPNNEGTRWWTSS